MKTLYCHYEANHSSLVGGVPWDFFNVKMYRGSKNTAFKNKVEEQSSIEINFQQMAVQALVIWVRRSRGLTR